MNVGSATLNQNVLNSDAKPRQSKVKLNAVFMVAVLPVRRLLKAKLGLLRLILSMAEKPVRSDLKPVISSLSYTNWKG